MQNVNFQQYKSPELLFEVALRVLNCFWNYQVPKKTAEQEFSLAMYKLFFIGRAMVLGESFDACKEREYLYNPISVLVETYGFEYGQEITFQNHINVTVHQHGVYR